MTKPINRVHDPDWVRKMVFAVRHQGFAVVNDVLDAGAVADLREAVANAARGIESTLGIETLNRSREAGHSELRLPMKYDSRLLGLLENREILAAIDATLGDTAVLRFMNADMVPPRAASGNAPPRAAATFHMNTPRCIPGYMASIEVALALTPMGFLAAPGTHQKGEVPGLDLLEWAAEPVTIPMGSMLVFDSTMWHCEMPPESGETGMAIEMQFTRSFIKPHFDYPRALGEECLRSLPVRTRQLLGWHTRLPASLEEFYLTGEERLYQPGQG